MNENEIETKLRQLLSDMEIVYGPHCYVRVSLCENGEIGVAIGGQPGTSSRDLLTAIGDAHLEVRGAVIRALPRLEAELRRVGALTAAARNRVRMWKRNAN